MKFKLLTKEQQYQRRQQHAAKRKEIIDFIKNHKREFFYIFMMIVSGVLILSTLFDELAKDSLKEELAVQQNVINCFYNEPCRQKIINLSLDTDKPKIEEIAYAYGLKGYMAKFPNAYKNASSETKARIDKKLTLIK